MSACCAPSGAGGVAWTTPLAATAEVRVKVFRFKGRDFPRAVVAVASPLVRGYRWLHLTRPVAFHARRGVPAWMYRAAAAVSASLDGTASASHLSAVAEAAHRGKGIRKRENAKR